MEPHNKCEYNCPTVVFFFCPLKWNEKYFAQKLQQCVIFKRWIANVSNMSPLPFDLTGLQVAWLGSMAKQYKTTRSQKFSS